MFCKYCGASIATDSLFCSSCGKSVNSEEIGQNEKKNGETNTWFYQNNNHLVIRMSYEEMVNKIKNGVIDFNGKVRADKDSEWTPLSNSVFASIIDNLPPRQVSISDKWVWCLAILPILIPILLKRFGILPSTFTYDWIICVFFNGLFLILDKNEIEKSGIYESWSYLGIILVPLYLVIREVKTNHNYSPAIINAFILAVDIFIL